MRHDYRPGDILARRKAFVMHKGIALGDGRVLHNTPWRGEHVSTEREFLAGKRLRVTRLDAQARRRALGAAQQSSRRYNLFTNNCEHTVNRATTGKATSPQLQGWLVGAGVAVLAFAAARHPAPAVAGYALGRKFVKQMQNRHRVR